jgi:murein L,D-transpeptidase YcbB/YkuD
VVSWTSHDMPGFRLPWREILARVDVHSPQHYPAQAGRSVGQRELEARIHRSRGRWEVLAEQGEIPGDAAPYGDRWVPYLQGHGHTPGALVWGLCEAPVVRLWAYPGSWSPEAIPALRRARAIRSNTDVTLPDVVARWQQAQGLDPDGVVGPKTLAALGA